LIGRRSDHRDGATCPFQRDLARDYAFLLGFYLGDGYLTQQKNGVRKLRIGIPARSCEDSCSPTAAES
jgi:hypothetical protein